MAMSHNPQTLPRPSFGELFLGEVKRETEKEMGGKHGKALAATQTLCQNHRKWNLFVQGAAVQCLRPWKTVMGSENSTLLHILGLPKQKHLYEMV